MTVSPAPGTVPPPPPGPGVQPPFVAPPTDGTRRRRGWTVTLSIGAVVLVCLLGAGTVAGMGVLLVRSALDQAKASVTAYLTALRDQKYDAAYDQLCDDLRSTTTRRQFEQQQRDRPALTAFEVGDVQVTKRFEVPAQLTHAGGSHESVRIVVVQDPKAGNFEVCGEAD